MLHRLRYERGYSVKNADKIGPELLGKTRVSEEIDKRKAERSKRTGINADRVLQELARIAFANAKDIVDFNTGEVLPSASEEDLAVIQSVKVKTTSGKVDSEEREVKLCDKQKALEALCKHLGICKETVKAEIEPSSKFADICKQLGGEGLSEWGTETIWIIRKIYRFL